jgi:ELWxxDGT repeat protein
MAPAFFAGVDGACNVGLWVTHGTAASTHEITVDGAPSGGLNPSDLTVFNHHEVLFTGLGGGLWVTNGTTAGTHEIALDGASSVGNLTVFNHDVLFSALDASNNLGLWITDGTTAGTHEITVNGAYSTGVHPYDLTVFNGEECCHPSSHSFVRQASDG